MKINKSRFLCKVALVVSIFVSNDRCDTMIGGGGDVDPLISLRYRDAFDQQKIFNKFRDLMEHWGCDKNVFQDAISTNQLKQSSGQKAKRDEAFWAQRKKAFEKACLAKLAWERRGSIGKPVVNASVFLALMVVGTYVTNKFFVDKNSLGGSFGTANTIMGSAFILFDIIRTGSNFWRTQPHLVDELEKEYAVNQCFIPRDLWSLIIEKFTAARSNPHEELRSINFIKFALGFKQYRPLEPVLMRLPSKPLQKAEKGPVAEEILRRIDTFFACYETRPAQLSALKEHVSAFISQLINGGDDSLRCQYLVGSYGKGKNQFVTELASWIDELLPQSLHYEEFKVSSLAELEGSPNQAGLFLTALRNQLRAKRRGVIIFMDEATWLNEQHLTSEAKRVFNENFSKISTQYFGNDIAGHGLNLSLPPTLVFVASNEPIKDGALSSRFDSTPFPEPKGNALADHAVDVFRYGRNCLQKEMRTESMLFAMAKERGCITEIENQLKIEILCVIDSKPSAIAQEILKFMNNIKTIDNFRDAGTFAERFASLRLFK